jgi:hypothetical protein
MKPRSWNPLGAFLLLVILAGSMPGCFTLGGLVLGHGSDLAISPTQKISKTSIDSIKQGTMIALIGIDGGRREGIFSGFTGDGGDKTNPTEISSEGKVPPPRQVRLRAGEVIVNVPLEEISFIEVPKKRKAFWYGALFDAMILAVAAIAGL